MLDLVLPSPGKQRLYLTGSIAFNKSKVFKDDFGKGEGGNPADKIDRQQIPVKIPV